MNQVAKVMQHDPNVVMYAAGAATGHDPSSNWLAPTGVHPEIMYTMMGTDWPAWNALEKGGNPWLLFVQRFRDVYGVHRRDTLHLASSEYKAWKARLRTWPGEEVAEGSPRTPGGGQVTRGGLAVLEDEHLARERGDFSPYWQAEEYRMAVTPEEEQAA